MITLPFNGTPILKFYITQIYRFSTGMNRAAGFIVYRKNNEELEFLLLKASYGSFHWSVPKGFVETGETDLEAAYRETKEEAGFNKDDLKKVEEFQKDLKYSVNGVTKTVVYFLAELITEKPVALSSEHTEYKWCKLTEACELVSFENFQKLLKKCGEYLKKK